MWRLGEKDMQVYEKIKTMSLSELENYFQQIFDPNKETFGCGSCIDYGTHHCPKDCIRTNCEWLAIGTSIRKWLESTYISEKKEAN